MIKPSSSSDVQPATRVDEGGGSQGQGLNVLISLFAQLPGMGMRSARRAVLHLLTHRDSVMVPLSAALAKAHDDIKICGQCGNWDVQDPCSICRDSTREQDTLCVVEGVSDVWAIERSGAYRGRYFVLGGTLSALQGKDPEALGMARLVDRVAEDNVREVILATSATLEGQTTAHYIEDLLADKNVVISRLGQGLPFGGELDYLDDTTLASAFCARR
ncbi:MAG: recombination protein RecR [Alphaproteobacteria bacterium GM202ARS2]|nr:recombination protein RecR [Alphaproteobacteria bacterium GM202ARS2]